MRRLVLPILPALLAALLFATTAQAAVTRIEISERADLPVRGFERIAGRVYFAVDPKLEANKAIADIALAPTNAQGLVEFSSDFLVFRAKSAEQSNGTALLEIVNRGRPLLWSGLNTDASGAMREPKDFGDAFTLHQGFTMIWLGWQFDIAPTAGSYKLYAPVIDAVNGQDLTGPVRVEALPDNLTHSTPLPYPVADPDSGTLTVRDEVYGVRTAIPREQWTYNADQTGIEYSAGFSPGRIYEFIYMGKDPAVAGLGFAAIRDFVSHLKNAGLTTEDRPGAIQRAMSYGFSQSGRFLRSYLHDGFNADEQGKRVFEGVWAAGAGGGRGSFNQRFAQPGRTSGQFSGSYYPTDIPPYLPGEILAKSIAQGVTPKLILTNGSHEYWGRAASLNHVAQDGSHVAPDPENTRIYLVSGTQHSAGGRQVSRNDPQVQNPTNPMDWTFFMRAMLVNANNWITRGVAPPPSSYPNGDQSVSIDHFQFPALPGIKVPRVAYEPWDLDFGPEYKSSRIVSFEPPALVSQYPALLPRVDSDGNETSGIRLPELQVPLATYTGWNLRSERVGSTQQLYSLIGSFIPFAKTRSEREKSGDPRPSIAERYTSGQDYLSRIEAAAKKLAVEGFLLEADIPEVVKRAEGHWRQWAVLPAAQATAAGNE